jgi:GT2 family glycosyltransferase
MTQAAHDQAALSIVVISYNTRDMTLACLASVYAETQIPFELIVLDNASTDGSAEAIARSYPEATLIAEKTNHGFGPAHRIALKSATAPWLLLLNPDTVILDNAIDNLFNFAKRTPDAGIWGGRTLYADGSLNPTSCFGKMTLWSVFCRVIGFNGVFRRSAFFNSEYYGNWPRDSERSVDIVTGCLFLIKRELWDRLGGFDDTFVMYGEEVDLCLKAHKTGVRPRITPDATIIHHGGASQAVRSDKMVRLMRAKMELIKRHFPSWQRGLGLKLFRLWPLSRLIVSKCVSIISKEESKTIRTQVWCEVWARREEWQDGFAGSTTPSGSLERV